MTSVSFFHVCNESLRKMPPGVGFWLIFIGLGVGVLKSFLPRGGEFAHQKDCLRGLPGSGLELTDT